MTREERAAQVAALLAEGKVLREIGEIMGIARSSASDLINDPDGSRARSRKAKYGGVCETCGARTDGSNGRAKAPRICRQCQLNRIRDNRKWTRDTIVASINDFVSAHGRLPQAQDMSPARARQIATAGYQTTVSHHDIPLPHHSSVIREFGSLAQAIRAAGYNADEHEVGRYRRGPATIARKQSFTDDDILEAMRRHAVNGSLSSWKWRRAAADHPSWETVSKRFGSWANALTKADLSPPPKGKRMRDYIVLRQEEPGLWREVSTKPGRTPTEALNAALADANGQATGTYAVVMAGQFEAKNVRAVEKIIYEFEETRETA